MLGICSNVVNQILPCQFSSFWVSCYAIYSKIPFMTFCAHAQTHLLENQHENMPNFFWNALKSLNSGQECYKMVWPHPLTKKPLDPNVWNSAGNSLKCRFIEDQDPNPAGSCIPALQLNTHHLPLCALPTNNTGIFLLVGSHQLDIWSSMKTLPLPSRSPPPPPRSVGEFQILFRCSLELQSPGSWLLHASLWWSLNLPKHKGVLPNSRLEPMLWFNYQNYHDLDDWEALCKHHLKWK